MGYDLLFQQALGFHEQGRLNEAETFTGRFWKPHRTTRTF